MHICLYVCMHCMHVCMYVLLYTCMYISMHLCVERGTSQDFEVSLNVSCCCVAARFQGWGELWRGPTHRHHHGSGHAEQPSLQILQDQYDPQATLHHRSPAGYGPPTPHPPVHFYERVVCKNFWYLLAIFNNGHWGKTGCFCRWKWAIVTTNASIRPSYSPQAYPERRWRSTRSPARKPPLSSGFDRSPSPSTQTTCVPVTLWRREAPVSPVRPVTALLGFSIDFSCATLHFPRSKRHVFVVSQVRQYLNWLIWVITTTSRSTSSRMPQQSMKLCLRWVLQVSVWHDWSWVYNVLGIFPW